MSRPSKYTKAVRHRLLSALRLGVPRVHACEAAGIHRDTLADWLKTKSGFSDEIEQAEAEAVVHHVKRIEKASKSGVWTASAFILERTRPAHFAKHEQLSVTQDVSVNVTEQRRIIVEHIAGTLPNGPQRLVSALYEDDAPDSEQKALSAGSEPSDVK